MGCYGPGDSPKMYQECSANPRLCGIKYEGVKSKSLTESKKNKVNATAASKIQILNSSIAALILGLISNYL